MNSSWEGGPGLWHTSRCRIERDCSLCVSPLSRTQKSGFSHGQNYPSNCRNPAGKALKKWEEDSCCTCFCQRGVKLQPKGSPRNYREGQNKVQTCGVQGGLESPFNSQVFGSRGGLGSWFWFSSAPGAALSSFLQVLHFSESLRS